MFTQIEQSLERSDGGLGIGLTLVQRLVELHNGTVSAASEGTGRGSEFVVRLPIHKEIVMPSSDSTDGELKHAAPRRILVVDDNRDSASSLAMLLKMTGHETQTAFDGLAAVETAESFRPDVVLLDIGLPRLNGYEAARKIREQPWGQTMVLVALTGWGQDDDRQKSADAGFNAHLVKPVEYATLNKLLTELRPSDS
ncbi:MAG: response regulator [Planctomycetes bacterium]|nr:response regulator [Planctomycetota bacterium]